MQNIKRSRILVAFAVIALAGGVACEGAVDEGDEKVTSNMVRVLCPNACNDGVLCTLDYCEVTAANVYTCAHDPDPAMDGACCDSACNSRCEAGVCESPKCWPGQCDDGIPCTVDVCDPATGACSHVPAFDGLCCDDACNSRCSAGACVTPKCWPGQCNDGVPCTQDICDPATGACSHVPANDGACCNQTCDGRCLAGVCVYPKCWPGQCDDGSPCTGDACDPLTGACSHTPANVGACCDSACNSTCNASGQCESPKCWPGQCDDGILCTVDACDANTGNCLHTPVPNGTCCDETCQATCQNGACAQPKCWPGQCDDGNVCTLDLCDANTGACSRTPTNAGGCCDSTCTSRCDTLGACVTPKCWPGQCDDGISCTADTCDPATGACSHAPANEGACCDSACNGRCAGGACTLPKCWPGQCNDGNLCTTDACDPLTGACSHVPANVGACCDDACHGTCDAAGQCVYPKCGPGQCNDGNVCTADTCDPVTGACSYVPANLGACCDTACHGTCNALGQCETPKCWPGQCADGNACTVDTCDPLTGACGHAPANEGGCCDSNCNSTCVAGACTTPKCWPGQCEDGNPCTLDACNPLDGACSHTATNEGACCDVDCHTTCVSGRCEAPKCHPGQCDDGNVCTMDACDPVTGACSHVPVPNGLICEPVNGSQCVNGQCQTPKCWPGQCNDGSVCTTDTCDPNTGACGHAPVADGTCCDSTCVAKCRAGICESPKCWPGQCDDGNPCTVDACDPNTGACSHVAAPDFTCCSPTCSGICVLGGCLFP